MWMDAICSVARATGANQVILDPVQWTYEGEKKLFIRLFLSDYCGGQDLHHMAGERLTGGVGSRHSNADGGRGLCQVPLQPGVYTREEEIR